MYLLTITRPSAPPLPSASDTAPGFVVSRRWRAGGCALTLQCHPHLLPSDAPWPENRSPLDFHLGTQPRSADPLRPGPWIRVEVDGDAGRIRLTRDPAGLMAAFFAEIPHGYIISDSVPEILRHTSISRLVDIEALNEYWFLDYCIAPKTIWKAVRAVPNGHLAQLDLRPRSQPVYEQYWFPGRIAQEGPPVSAAQAPGVLREVVLRETQQAINAAPGGFVNLLSGGIDSSVVLAACHVLGRPPEQAITFKGVGEADESGLAAITARRLGVPLTIASADADDVVEDAFEVARVWGQPYAHGSVHAMQNMLRQAPAGRAVLTGDGGGEAFLGPLAQLPRGRWLAGRVFRLIQALPRTQRRALYSRLASRSFLVRGAAYALEKTAARNEAQMHLRDGPVTEWESEAIIAPEKHGYFSKPAIATRLTELASLSQLPGESLFAKNLAFCWAAEGVYAKTWRLLDASGRAGYGPLTGPRYYEEVKRIPIAERGTRKQALRDAFADVLPAEVLHAPKRGLRPLNRELLAAQADAGISWITDRGSETWERLFDSRTVASFWRSHRDGRVFRSNLLYKAVIFRAWSDLWKPILEEPGQ